MYTSCKKKQQKQNSQTGNVCTTTQNLRWKSFNRLQVIKTRWQIDALLIVLKIHVHLRLVSPYSFVQKLNQINDI